jgi:hypothetical protein
MRDQVILCSELAITLNSETRHDDGIEDVSVRHVGIGF